MRIIEHNHFQLKPASNRLPAPLFPLLSHLNRGASRCSSIQTRQYVFLHYSTTPILHSVLLQHSIPQIVKELAPSPINGKRSTPLVRPPLTNHQPAKIAAPKPKLNDRTRIVMSEYSFSFFSLGAT